MGSLEKPYGKPGPWKEILINIANEDII